MAKRGLIVACVLAASLALAGKPQAQTASPESLAAAKELIIAAKMADQIKFVTPMLMQQLKPLIAKGNPLVERDFDALIPVVMTAMNVHLDEFLASGAQVYAKHFTAEEMERVTNFYRSPAGQKFLEKQPDLMRENMALGQRFGQAVAKDIQSRMTEELRKRGHNI